MFYTPEKPCRAIYTLYVMSDSYLGLDQQYDLHLEVLPQSIEAQMNTELADAFQENLELWWQLQMHKNGQVKLCTAFVQVAFHVSATVKI